MIFIKKDTEPESFKKVKKRNPGLTWDQFSERFRKEKDELRSSILNEQGYVCCFCGCGIKHKRTIISHIAPRSIYQSKELSYDNLMCSCDTTTSPEKHCDASQGNKILPINPTQNDCLSFFSFTADGKICESTVKSDNEQKKTQN